MMVFFWIVMVLLVRQNLGVSDRCGGSNENPTLAKIGKQELALNVMNSELITNIKENTCGRAAEIGIT